MRLFFPIIIIVSLMLMLVGHTLYQTGEVENIYNLTEQSLVWNYSYNPQVIQNVSDITSINKARIGRISNVIIKGMDFFGYSFMEIGKFFIEFGFENPQYNYNTAIIIVKWYLIIIIIALCVPLIVPAVLLIYVIILAFYKLFTKSKSKKEQT